MLAVDKELRKRKIGTTLLQKVSLVSDPHSPRVRAQKAGRHRALTWLTRRQAIEEMKRQGADEVHVLPLCAFGGSAPFRLGSDDFLLLSLFVLSSSPPRCAGGARGRGHQHCSAASVREARVRASMLSP